MSDAKRALVAGHADFAAGLISAVEQITGLGSLLIPIQVKGLNSDDIQCLIRDAIAEHHVRVVFTDLQAGSCTMAARRVQREMPGVVLIAGANLPMLLDFVFSTQEDMIEGARASAERGRASITITGATA